MSRRRFITYGALLIAGGIACWFFPLFHLRPLSGVKAESGVNFQLANGNRNANLNAGGANGERHKLDAYAAGATEITRLWNAFDANVSQAQSQYGRQAGLGGAWTFCVRGHGTVEAVEKNRVVLTIANSSRRACLDLDVVVDNTVRDAVGVKASEFANSQDFNDVSAELNRQVEQNVIAPNRTPLKHGAVADFVGCARIGGKSDLDPLCLIPIQLKVLGNGAAAEPAARSTDRESTGNIDGSTSR